MRISDWSSDVCSSDLTWHSSQNTHALRLHCAEFSKTTNTVARCSGQRSTQRKSHHVAATQALGAARVVSTVDCLWSVQLDSAMQHQMAATTAGTDRKSVGEGKSVSVSVDLGGSRSIKKKKKNNKKKGIRT